MMGRDTRESRHGKANGRGKPDNRLRKFVIIEIAIIFAGVLIWWSTWNLLDSVPIMGEMPMRVTILVVGILAMVLIVSHELREKDGGKKKR